jgi:glycerophosphoryl diester phosphodiesterase
MLKKILTGIIVFIGILVVIYVVLALLSKPAESHVYFEEGPPRPWNIAHQGGDGLWPSNTMFAMEQAAEMGVDVLEMDIHQTADGTLVVMHDETVDRTTDGNGQIKEMTLAELKELDAGHNWTDDDGQTYPYRGQDITVPTLEEIFARFPNYRMVIEIKQSAPSITEPFCDLIREYGMEEKVIVGSFSQDVVNEFRQVCPEVATSAGQTEVITFFILSSLFLENIYTPEALALQIPETRSGITVLTNRLIEAAHKRGMEVQVWTIDDQEDQKRILEMGVDGIMTDRPDHLMEAIAR